MRERSKINKDSFDLLYEEAAKDSADYIRKYIDEAVRVSGSNPVLIDKFLNDAIEVDVADKLLSLGI